MKRHVLVIPLEEIKAHFSSNQRQDVKIIAPEVLSQSLFQMLKDKGRAVKQEKILDEQSWSHSNDNESNKIVESGSFFSVNTDPVGQFALSFGNDKAAQDSHFHEKHSEIYYSEHPISASYRILGQKEVKTIVLKNGGAIVFSPNVIHKMELIGLTIVIESPSVVGDKIEAEL